MGAHNPLAGLLDEQAEGGPCGDSACGVCSLFGPLTPETLARLGAEVRADTQQAMRTARIRNLGAA